MIGRVFPSSAIESGQTPTVPLLDTLAPLRATFGNESSDTIRVTNRRKEAHGGVGFGSGCVLLSSRVLRSFSAEFCFVSILPVS